MLKAAGVHVTEHSYLQHASPDLLTHFRILEAFQIF